MYEGNPLMGYVHAPWMCQWWLGVVQLIAACWAELIALLQLALFGFCHLVGITMTICAVRYRGKDATYTMSMSACTHTHTHTRTHMHVRVSFTSSGVSQIWQSKCLSRPKMTGVQDRGSDAETRPPGFTHGCLSRWQPAEHLQHFSTSAPIWPPLNITVVYLYDVEADYIMGKLMLVIFTLYLLYLAQSF